MGARRHVNRKDVKGETVSSPLMKVLDWSAAPPQCASTDEALRAYAGILMSIGQNGVEFSNAVPGYSEVHRNDQLSVSDHIQRSWTHRIFIRTCSDRSLVGYIDFSPLHVERELKISGFTDHHELVEAYLRWPAAFRGFRRISFNAGQYTDLGGEELPCVSWVPCQPDFLGRCSHAACHTVLDLLREQGAGTGPLGIFDLGRVARESTKTTNSLMLPTGGHGAGLTAVHMERALSSPWTRITGAVDNIQIEPDDDIGNLIAQLRAYVLSHVPCILCIDWNEWTKVEDVRKFLALDGLIGDNEKQAYDCLENLAAGQVPNGLAEISTEKWRRPDRPKHAVVLAGYKGGNRASPDDTFVVIDPTVGPFITVKAEQLVACMDAYASMPQGVEHSVMCVVPLPRQVRLRVTEAHEAAHWNWELGLPEHEEKHLWDAAATTYVLQQTKALTPERLAQFLQPMELPLPESRGFLSDIRSCIQSLAGDYVWIVGVKPDITTVKQKHGLSWFILDAETAEYRVIGEMYWTVAQTGEVRSVTSATLELPELRRRVTQEWICQP